MGRNPLAGLTTIETSEEPGITAIFNVIRFAHLQHSGNVLENGGLKFASAISCDRLLNLRE